MIKRGLYVIVFLVLIGIVSGATSVSQNGVTWTFNRDYSVGQFANGDYWVVGPVTITSITPNFDGSNNGWEVNPVSNGQQGYDSECTNFYASLVPSLPYTASPGDSIMKTIDSGTDRPCLRTAAILTVVDSVPPGNGADVFRPPFVGENKPYYYVSDLQTQLLPSLDPVANAPSLDWVEDRFVRVQVDYEQGTMGRRIRPSDHMPDYGSAVGKDNGDGALRLMLNDPINNKMPALIAYVQYGIDLHHAILNGQTWPDGGGYNPGRKLPLTFAAVLLDHQSMKNQVIDADFFQEDTMIQVGQGGRALFGEVISEQTYLDYIAGCPQSNTRQWADPYGYIDGGCPTDSYQSCCLSQPWKSSAIAVHLMPEMKSLWDNRPAVFDYVDRWVEHGTWTLPDPYNRFPDKHGIDTDGGHYGSAFAGAMWDAYRYYTPEPCTGYCCPSGYTCSSPTSGTCSSGTCCLNQVSCTSTTQTCSQLGGSCCSSGQTCSGSFQSSSDCGALCCVGGTCQTPSNFLPEQIIEAEEGVISSMQTGSGSGESGEYVYTPTSFSGSVSYIFDIVQAGQYRIDSNINSQGSDGSNSFYVVLGSYDPQTPRDDEYIYATLVTDVFVWDNVSLIGSGTIEEPEFDPMVWDLTADTHTFTFYGREIGTWLDQIILKKLGDDCVDFLELVQIINDWKADNVQMSDVMDAISLWRAGC